MQIGIRRWLRYVWEDFKAWRRGEIRVLPRGHRGRVYVRQEEVEKMLDDKDKIESEVPEETEKPGGHAAFAEATATLDIVVTRADGTVEHYTSPAELETE